MTGDARLHAPATLRNREPLLDALRRRLPPSGLVVEVASGTGEHVAFFARHMPALAWQPSDPDEVRRTSIDAHASGLGNVRPAISIDATAPWPRLCADAIVCINMIHIAPWAATRGLFDGAATILAPGGPLILYGPFIERGETAPSNRVFDADLRAQDAAWGVRDLDAVAAVARAAGFGPPTVEEMPANNRLVVFRYSAAIATCG